MVLWTVVTWACATEPGENPIPDLTRVTPDTLMLVADSVTITLTGTGFVWNALVEWDTIPLPMEAEFVSSRELRGLVRSGHTNDGGTHFVRVRNPPPGGGLSAPVAVVVTYPAPVIDSIVPDSAIAGSHAWSGSVWGRGFALSSTELAADGATIPWWTATRTRFDTGLDSTTIAVPRTILITVTNPAPGGGTASAVLRVVAGTGGP